MSIAEKLIRIAENEHKVFAAGLEKGKAEGGYSNGFDAGKQAQNEALWGAIQNDGNRTEYGSAFFGGSWTKETFKPTFSIRPTQAASCFLHFNNAPNDLEQIDFVELAEKQGIEIDFSACKNMNMAFGTGGISRLGTVDVRQSTILTGTFYGSYNKQQGLVTIERLIVSENTVFATNTFQDCAFLEHLTVEGIIAHDLNLQWSKKLSRASIESVLWAADESIFMETPPARFTLTLSLAAVNRAFETSEGANDGTESADWKSHINNTESYYTTALL